MQTPAAGVADFRQRSATARAALPTSPFLQAVRTGNTDVDIHRIKFFLDNLLSEVKRTALGLCRLRRPESTKQRNFAVSRDWGFGGAVRFTTSDASTEARWRAHKPPGLSIELSSIRSHELIEIYNSRFFD